MEIIIAIANFSLLLGVATWIGMRDNSVVKKIYWPTLLLKLLAGVALGIIYSAYYPDSDTFYFFDSAVEVSQRAYVDFAGYLNFLISPNEGYFLGQARTLFFIKITSVIALFTANNYWIASLYFSLISFLSAWWLTTSIARYFSGYKEVGIIALLLFPSCVFWSSGLVKESLAMAGLFCMAAVFLRVWMERKISVSGVLIIVLSTGVIWNLKYYYIGLFGPVILTAWVTKKIVSFLEIKNFGIEILLWTGLLVAGLFIMSFMHPNFFFDRVVEVVVSNNAAVMKASSPEDVIHYNALNASWLSMILNAPWALLSGLFRPFIWEADSVTKVVAAVENIVLLLLTVWALPTLTKLKYSPHRLLVVSMIGYSILLCAFLALSTPNFGTLIRYRVGFLPFFVLLIVNRSFLIKPLSKFL